MDTDNFSNYGDWSDGEQRIDRAHEFYENGHWLEALRELQEAIEINPSNSTWLFNKALTLDTLERFNDAINIYEQLHELEPSDPEILNCLIA